ncbi:MAG: tRNA (N(6)-L-threonylcarbamoyladenosine(37)-C(2))-methylthiotransferase MtaB [Bacteroidales bacterium]|nr:tRNA (N(6)-L-threonylcarbamoyladenosine(37)-C(2))-methylthiotransferase MtaB [Bacteroidales bacterium]
MNTQQSQRVAFATLGCKLNYAESSTLSRQFEAAGYVVVPPTQVADVYVINTCSVTEHSDKKCRNIIRRLSKRNLDAIVAVTGCYAQLKAEEIAAIPGVDLVVGADQKGNLFARLADLSSQKVKGPGRVHACAIHEVTSIFPAYSTGERTRSFLKVQDGCNYRCSYCTIPLARGESRNIPIATAVEEAERIAASGVREIVLTGVNTGDFGRTTGESFLDLLKALNQVQGIERYRISSIEPNLLTEEILQWIASGTKFAPHFHVPLQSGSDAVLAAMRRRYNTTRFREKIALIRQYLDHVFIGIDVIVGFPGETQEHFEETYRLLEELQPSFLHVFPYSRRPGTDAALMSGQVDERIKEERVARLTALSDRLHEAFCQANEGREESVLFESTIKGGMMYGYTSNYIRVERPYDRTSIGKMIKVTL